MGEDMETVDQVIEKLQEISRNGKGKYGIVCGECGVGVFVDCIEVCDNLGSNGVVKL